MKIIEKSKLYLARSRIYKIQRQQGDDGISLSTFHLYDVDSHTIVDTVSNTNLEIAVDYFERLLTKMEE